MGQRLKSGLRNQTPPKHGLIYSVAVVSVHLYMMPGTGTQAFRIGLEALRCCAAHWPPVPWTFASTHGSSEWSQTASLPDTLLLRCCHRRAGTDRCKRRTGASWAALPSVFFPGGQPRQSHRAAVPALME